MGGLLQGIKPVPADVAALGKQRQWIASAADPGGRLAASGCAAFPQIGPDEAAYREVAEQSGEAREEPEVVGARGSGRGVEVRTLAPGRGTHRAGQERKENTGHAQPKGAGEDRQRLPDGAFQMLCAAAEIPGRGAGRQHAAHEDGAGWGGFGGRPGAGR